jgi:hypothetical protein
VFWPTGLAGCGVTAGLIGYEPSRNTQRTDQGLESDDSSPPSHLPERATQTERSAAHENARAARVVSRPGEETKEGESQRSQEGEGAKREARRTGQITVRAAAQCWVQA